jgi:hypothetical protein
MLPFGMLVALGSRRFGAFKRRLFGSLRLASYVLVVGGLLLGALSTRAHARLREQSLTLSRELLPLADLLKDATGLRLNGEVVNFSMTVLEATSVDRVLDRVQAQCETHPGPLAQQSQALLASLPHGLPGTAALAQLLAKLAVTREQTDSQGSVLCFTGGDATAHPDFAERFENTNDLGALGNLRYVMAGQGDPSQNEQGLTRVVTLWTEGRFRLDRLAPPEAGDAAGSDSPLIPRPPHAVRILSAEAIGAPYSVRIYETDASAGDVLAFYDGRMAGFSRLTLPGYEESGRAYVKKATPLLLHLSRSGSKSLVTLSEVGAAAELEKVTRVER